MLGRGIGVRLAAAWLAGLFLLPLAVSPTPADAAQKKNARVVRPVLPAPEKDAAVVVDGATGKVLYARNPDAARYPASLTKMMTLYLLFEALDSGKMSLDTPMIASSHAVEQQPTKLYVPLGSSIKVETAIKALTVLSANDVAVVIAEALGEGSEETFATMMTEKARRLGMTNTNFRNASGLPDLQQFTTARDMAMLGRHIAYDYPHYYRYFSVTSFAFNGRTYGTHDNLLAAFKGTDGIKTGYTQLSGFNLVTSAVRDNRHVVGVVLGGPTAAQRDREMMRLLNAAFDVAKENPYVLAEANVPWNGGAGPAGEIFKSDPGQEDVLVAALEPKSKTRKYVAASVGEAALRLSDTLKTVVDRTHPLEAAQTGLAEASSVAGATGRNAGKAVKKWAVQIGIFANETLARAKLAAFAKRDGASVGQAEKMVIRASSSDGHVMYRARFGMFAENEARDICKRMEQMGQDCFAALSDAG